MRLMFIAGAVAAILAGPAFAGSPPPIPPTPPTPPNSAPITVSQTQSVQLATGVQVTANMHTGSLALASSTTLKSNTLLGASLSVSNAGFTTP
jgi:hypothetical protein